MVFVPSSDKLLTHIGNAEHKCMVQLLVGPEEAVGTDELNLRFASAQSPHGTVSYKQNTLASLVTHSHAHGQIQQFKVSGAPEDKSWWTYKHADETTGLGDIVAKHQLWLAADTAFPLEGIFGRSGSPTDTLSPDVRLRIFSAISGLMGSTTILDICDYTWLPPKLVRSSIVGLRDLGLVNYDVEPGIGAVGQISMTKAQKAVIGRIARASIELERRNPKLIRQIEAEAKRILDDRPLLTEILARGQAFSPSANRVTYQDRVYHIRELMASGGWLSTRNIFEGLGPDAPHTLDGITAVLRRMADSGEIEVTKQGVNKLWRLTKPADQ